MNTTTAILKAIAKNGTACFSEIYSTVVSRCAPYPCEFVQSEIDRLCAEGKIRKLRLGGTAEWTVVQ